MLNAAAFNDEFFNEVRGTQLTAQAEALLEEVRSCAADIPSCAQ
jgi:hypothetical protein